MHTNAYKGGGGGLNMTKSTHFVCSFIENATISKIFIKVDDTSQRGIGSAHVNFISMICC